MKYTAALVALAAVASAQTLADIPSCALPCLQKAVAADTSCSSTDVACICKNFSEVQGDSTACVIKACGSDVAINQVLPAAQALCANGGSGGSGGATTTAAASSSSAAAVSSTEAAVSSSSGGYVVPTTVATTVTSAYVSSITTPVSSVSGAPTGGNGTVTTTAFPGAAPVVGSIGGLAMLALGALAL